MAFLKIFPALVVLCFVSFAFSSRTRPAALMPAEATASYSYKLDGTTVSGGEVDELALHNCVELIKSGGGPGKLVFFLSDGYNEQSMIFAHSMRFTIPAKPGSVSVRTDDENWKIEFFLAAGADSKYLLYSNEAFTINVTGTSAARVTGTFSGKFQLVSGDGKKELMVTDGKFDLPMRKTGK